MQVERATCHEFAARVVKRSTLAVDAELFAAQHAISIAQALCTQVKCSGRFDPAGAIVEPAAARRDLGTALHRADGTALVVNLRGAHVKVSGSGQQPACVVKTVHDIHRQLLPGTDLTLPVIQTVADQDIVATSGKPTALAIVDCAGSCNDEAGRYAASGLNDAMLIGQYTNCQPAIRFTGDHPAGVVEQRAGVDLNTLAATDGAGAIAQC